MEIIIMTHKLLAPLCLFTLLLVSAPALSATAHNHEGVAQAQGQAQAVEQQAAVEHDGGCCECEECSCEEGCECCSGGECSCENCECCCNGTCPNCNCEEGCGCCSGGECTCENCECPCCPHDGSTSEVKGTCKKGGCHPKKQ